MISVPDFPLLHPWTGQVCTAKPKKGEKQHSGRQEPKQELCALSQMHVLTHRYSTNPESNPWVFPAHHSMFILNIPSNKFNTLLWEIKLCSLHSIDSCTALRIHSQCRIILILADLTAVDLKMCDTKWRLMVRNLDGSTTRFCRQIFHVCEIYMLSSPAGL